LTDTHNTNHISLFVTTRGSIQQYFNTCTSLGHQRKLKVSSLFSAESSIQHGLNSCLEIIGNKLLNKAVSHDFLGGISHQSNSTLIPYIHLSFNVNTKDRSIRRINKFCIFTFLGDATGNILTDTNHTNHISLLITTCCGIQKDVQTDTSLGH